MRAAGAIRPDRPGVGALTLALFLLGLLWLGPFPALARTSFTMHMFLHLAVMLVAAPVLAFALVRLIRPRPRGGWLALGLAGAGAEMVVVWGWHVPLLHHAAMGSSAIFALQQASFLLAGLLVWLPGLAGTGRRAAGAAALTMAASFAHMSMLGVLLTTAPRLIYGMSTGAEALGLSPMDDQRLGGVLMAVAGGLPYMLGGMYFAARFLSEE